MSHMKPFGPGILCIIDDYSDVLEVKKSMLKTADYEILVTSPGVLLDMAQGRRDEPAARRPRRIVDPLTHCISARELLRMRRT